MMRAAPLLFLMLGGCHVLLPIGPSSAGRDRAADGSDGSDGSDGKDAGLPDRVRAPEGTAPDGTPVPDRATRPADSRGPDTSLLKTDGAASLVGCNPSLAASGKAATAKMVFCVGLSYTYTQCSAVNLCDQANGWALCTAAEYRAQYGGTGLPPPVTVAWIAGCIRNANNPFAPTSTICGSCSPGTASSIPVAWDCGSSLPSAISGGKVLGLVSWGTCNVVGTQASANAGFWWPQATESKPNAAVCCHP